MALSLDDILKLLDRLPLWKTIRGLPERVEKLEQRLAALEASKAPEKDFTEYDGALFKRNPDGSWQKTVFCPKCKTSTEQFPGAAGGMIFLCARCGWGSSFITEELPGILQKLP